VKNTKLSPAVINYRWHIRQQLTTADFNLAFIIYHFFYHSIFFQRFVYHSTFFSTFLLNGGQGY